MPDSTCSISPYVPFPCCVVQAVEVGTMEVPKFCMSITPEELTFHMQLGEDSAWGFKAVRLRDNRIAAPRQRDLVDEMAVSASTGRGVLVCGVDADGRAPT